MLLCKSVLFSFILWAQCLPSLQTCIFVGRKTNKCISGREIWSSNVVLCEHWAHSKWEMMEVSFHHPPYAEIQLLLKHSLLIGLLGDCSVSAEVPEIGSALICKWPPELMYTARSCRGGQMSISLGEESQEDREWRGPRQSCSLNRKLSKALLSFSAYLQDKD